MSTPADNPKSPTRNRLLKLAVLVGTVVAFGVIYILFRDRLTLEYLAQQEASLQDYRGRHPVLAYVIAFVIYVVVTGLSLPGATVMTLVLAWFFKFWRGLILVSFASTTGATLAFLLSRYLFHDYVQKKFGERIAGFNQALEREGAFYLFSLRLIPAVPFFVINVVMGLTPMRVRTYWWVSQLGMLAGTSVYVYAGSQFPNLQELAQHGVRGILDVRLIGAFIALGLFPLAVKRLMAWWRPATTEQAPK